MKYYLETTLPVPGAGEIMTPEEWHEKYGYINITDDKGFFKLKFNEDGKN